MRVILLSICLALLIMPISLILTTIVSINTHAAYASDHASTAWDKKGYLRFVSNTMSNNSSSIEGENVAMTQIPESAKGPPIPDEGYLVEEIRDNLYWVTDGTYDTMFLVTDEGVVAIDAPPSIGQNYLKAIANVTDKPITHVIYSHAHLDHIGAAGMFPKNATYIAHQATGLELQRAMSLASNISAIPPVPAVTFPNNYTLQVGNQTLNLDYYGDNHMPGNLFIYAPNQQTLMLVDVISPGWAPFFYLGIASDIPGYIKAHDIALNNYDFDTFVGGHLTRTGTRDDVVTEQEFISDLGKAAAQASIEVQFGDIAEQVGSTADAYLLFSKYVDAVVQNCVQTMLPKWESRLGGVETFMPTHCFAMTQYGRIEPSVSAILQNITMSGAAAAN
jgi:glyoxylase-like metal-dependent hydrolase (beta-lactamase superfamily II)